jgi:hypothetical protein
MANKIIIINTSITVVTENNVAGPTEWKCTPHGQAINQQ